MKLIDNYIRSLVNETIDKGISRVSYDQYIENLFEMVPASKKFGYSL